MGIPVKGKEDKKEKLKLRSKWRVALIALIMCGLFGTCFAAASYLSPFIRDKENSDIVDNAEGLIELPGITVLMMGVDEREDETSLRTDTMILANINSEENRIALLSIPRDTKVELPGYGVNKINAANIFGGPEMAMAKVSELTGTPVEHYIITNFDGFKDIVDALGGVTLDVEKEMHYHERAYGGAYNIDLNKGVQELDGDMALQYARFRYDELGDISRTQRQLKLLTAIGNEVMQPKVVTKLPKLVPQIYKHMDTNMSVSQLVTLAKAAKNIDNLQIVTQTMPGWFLDENGISYWLVEPEQSKQVATALFKDGLVVDVIEGAIDSNIPTQVALERSQSSSTQPVRREAPKKNENKNKNKDIDPDISADGTPLTESTNPGNSEIEDTETTDVETNDMETDDSYLPEGSGIEEYIYIDPASSNSAPVTEDNTSSVTETGTQGSDHVDVIVNPNPQ